MARPTTETWRTAISEVTDSSIRYRGHPVQDLIEHGSFEATACSILFDLHDDPDAADAVRRALIASADHGVAAPSIATARICSSTRIPVPAAIGAGLVAFAGPAHGGAAEACAHLMVSIAALVESADDLNEAVDEHVRKLLDRGERIPGYGHPVHRQDPRVAPLMSAPVSRDIHRRIARLIETRMLERSPRLTMNADSAVAALLLDAGLQPPDVSAITAIGRVVGLAAHATEELRREDPFRAPSPLAITYDGPMPI